MDKVVQNKVVPNKCFATRVEIEGCSYRCISFFHTHPSDIEEDGWAVFRNGSDTFLVDKLSLSLMAECECEFLTRAKDEETNEPTIVSVQMSPTIPSSPP